MLAKKEGKINLFGSVKESRVTKSNFEISQWERGFILMLFNSSEKVRLVKKYVHFFFIGGQKRTNILYFYGTSFYTSLLIKDSFDVALISKCLQVANNFKKLIF